MEAGQPHVGALGTESRKTVTVVFADIVESTALAEQLDPESLRSVVARYFDLAKHCLERHGATVEKFIGDAVMAVFGVPAVHEDDAVRAVRAAAEIVHSLAELNRSLHAEYGISLQIRIGINTGEVVVGTAERLATGDPVNVAARLQQAASPGEILVGAMTLRLAGDLVTAEPRGEFTLKGKSGSVPAFAVVAVEDVGTVLARSVSGAFVGREAEIVRLGAAFDDAMSGRQCRLATVLGVPGIGKSHLAQQLSREWAQRAEVLAGRCPPYGEGMTFWPLREIFMAADAVDEFDSALAAGGGEELFWRVRKFLENRARLRPIALVIDDIHWAEPMLLDFIEHLVDWAQDAPMMLLCLARPEFAEQRPTWAARANVELIPLEPLPADDADQLIERMAVEAALAPAVRQRIRDTAAGNPLFVRQLVLAAAESNASDEIPSTIAALLAARLDTLSDDERDVLERACVVGLDFEWQALAVLAPDGQRPPGALLSALIRKQFIQRVDLVADTFQFAHMLIRDAAYERLSKQRRASYHEGLARWLDTYGQEFDEVVGYHLEQAHKALVELGRDNDLVQRLAEEAAERLASCGARAANRGDPASAAQLFGRAAALSHDDARRAAILPTWARALREIGRMVEAEDALTEAVRLIDPTDRAAAAGARLALADIRLHRHAHTGTQREEVVREVEEAVAEFEQLGDDAGLGRALCLSAKLRFWIGDCANAVVDFERAAACSRRAGDMPQEAESLRALIVAMFYGPTPVEVVLSRLPDGGTAMDYAHEVVLITRRAELEAMRGRFDVARALVNDAVRMAQERGLSTSLETGARPGAGRIELLAGNYAAAEKFLRSACDAAERSGEWGYLSSMAPDLVQALLGLDRDGEAREVSERWRADALTVPEDAEAHASWRRAHAKVLARFGELAEAERLARESIAMAQRTDYLNLQADAYADSAVVLTAMGRHGEAAAAARQALEIYQRKGNLASAESMRAVLQDLAV